MFRTYSINDNSVVLVTLDFSHEQCPLIGLASRTNTVLVPRYINASTSRDWLTLYVNIPKISNDILQRFQHAFSDTLRLRHIIGSIYKRDIMGLVLEVKDSGLSTIRNVLMQFNALVNMPDLEVLMDKERYTLLLDNTIAAKVTDTIEDRLSHLGRVRILQFQEINEPEDFFITYTRLLLPPLSDEERKILLGALEEGYFDVPKRVTLDELARKFNMPKSTLDTKLRQTLNKILFRVYDMNIRYYRMLGVYQ